MSFYSNNPHFKSSIRKQLEKKGCKELEYNDLYDSKKIYYCDITYGKKKYDNFKKCKIMNQLENINMLGNKRDQYKYFIKYYGNTKKYIPYTISFDKENVFNLEKIFVNNTKRWIVKPDDSLSRNGVKIVDNYRDVLENVNNFKYNDWIIQEYIEDPLLLNNRKFHFRVYAIFVKTKTYKAVYIMNYGFIYTATDEYNDKIISEGTHLTGEYRRENVFMFPEDVTKIVGIQKWNKVIWPQLIKIVKETIFSVIDQLECPNKDNDDYKCFKIFGYDILIKNNLDCYLAEINARNLGYKYPKKGFKERYYDEILKCILKDKSLSTLELRKDNLPFERLLYIKNKNILESFNYNNKISVSKKDICNGLVFLSLILLILIINY